MFLLIDSFSTSYFRSISKSLLPASSHSLPNRPGLGSQHKRYLAYSHSHLTTYELGSFPTPPQCMQLTLLAIKSTTPHPDSSLQLPGTVHTCVTTGDINTKYESTHTTSRFLRFCKALLRVKDAAENIQVTRTCSAPLSAFLCFCLAPIPIPILLSCFSHQET